ncbi:DNA methyltransferase [candidate division WWE3 bacterium]|nr:DNA methyltransferase [candidate division WWE3 bacterium]
MKNEFANKKLQLAKAAKNDEFYTQYFDIEKEVSAYIEYNPDIFRNKTILLPCDDPEWSNFTKYFAQNFERFGIKKLISTSYATKSKNYKSSYQPTLFETNNPLYDANKTISNGKIFTLTKDNTSDGKVNIEDLEWHYLEGDGDFRSDELKKLRNEADIIITNPPFSLFREFLAWIVEAKKQFLLIGNLNAITYIEVFPLIKDNRVWLGNNYKINGGAMFYEIPENIANLEQVREIRTNENGEKVFITRVQGVRWFTNLDHGRLHEFLSLMTEADIIKFVTKKPFEKYDNYNAIEVSTVKCIPCDYKGVMGVPVSFLDKYNPKQFEILGSNRGVNQDPNNIYGRGSYLKGKEVYKRLFVRKRVTK